MKKSFNHIKVVLGITLTILFISAPLVNGYYASVKITEIGSIETNGEAMIVAVVENTAFVLDTTGNDPGGVMIIDITDPTSPILLSSLYDGGIPYEIAIKDDIVFVADGTDGLEILNVSDLENPFEIYQYPVNTYSSDVELVGDLLYTANWDYGLEIFNISNPESPVKICQYDEYSLNCMHVDVQGDIACVTDHRNDYTGIRILNITNPISPQLLDTYSPSSVDFWDPMIYGNYLYVGNHGLDGGELQIYNLTDPTNIVKVGEFDKRGNIHSVNFNGTLAFAADYNKGVIVLDIADPSNPIDIGGFQDGGHCKEVVVKGNLLFVADREDGLEILEVEITTETVPGFGVISGLIALVSIIVFSLRKRISKK